MTIGQTIFLVFGCATALLGAVILSRNWILVVGAVRGRESGSPVLGVGPLMWLVAGGLFAKAFPAALEDWWWGLGALGLVADPAGIPLVVWMAYSRAKR